MIYSVRWTTGSKITFNEVVDFLYLTWSKKEVNKFLDRTDEIVRHITKEPYLFKAYKHDPQIRHGILHKNITLFYRVIEDYQLIELIAFWDNRQNPTKQDFLFD